MMTLSQRAKRGLERMKNQRGVKERGRTNA